MHACIIFALGALVMMALDLTIPHIELTTSGVSLTDAIL
jgi:uncharacterized paraquat-inducible protein A